MAVRPYEPKDLDAINRWYVAHGKAPITDDLLPATGAIVDDVAAGFLYSTDSAVSVLDGFVTSPDAPLRRRFEALLGIIDHLSSVAKENGAQRVVGFTRSHGMERLVQRLGFARKGDYSLMVKGV